ncbi:MAG: Rieske (2Fe-2S) protein, partial [Actinomycetota bacterium]|nr:Rieske (2Fe-2S) protein [Actinomycetota bacterium]
MESELTWFRVGDTDIIDVGEVTVVQAGHHALALSRTEDGWGALVNRCPHQGGPLGEGLIEDCWLICPWHGWEYDPVTGETPGPFDDKVDSYAVDVRS